MPRKPTRRSAGTRQEAAAPEAARKPRSPRAKRAAGAAAPPARVPGDVPAAPASDAVVPAAAPNHDAIARLAREIWAGRGCPAGMDFEIWLEAERRLTSGS